MKKKIIHYDTIKIPEGITKIIDKIVDESEGLFTSRTDLIKHCIIKYTEGKNYGYRKNKKRTRTDEQETIRIDYIAGNGLAEIEAGSQRTDKDSHADVGNK